eukprot:Ihof_evm1s393 gene=Ihof_evmTU1s393
MQARILSSRWLITSQNVTRYLSIGLKSRGYSTVIRLGQLKSIPQVNHSVFPLAMTAPIGCALHQPSGRQFSTGKAHYISASDALPDGALLTNNIDVLANNPIVSEILGRASHIGELASLGLASNYPPGLLQQLLEHVSVDLGLPWWGAIMGVALGIRILLFPLALKGIRNNIRLGNIKPEMEKLQAKLTEAYKDNDYPLAMEYTNRLKDLLARNNCHPVKSLMLPLVQMPLLISLFLGIKSMAACPVESLSVGGLLWITDLTAADPYYILPIVSSVTMLACLELGSEGVTQAQQPLLIRNLLRGMCFMTVPLMGGFPAALFLYWVPSNIFSLSQLAFLRIPAVKSIFNIPNKKVIVPK